MIFLSILNFEELNTPEAILGLTAIILLVMAVIIGFIYKRKQSKK